MISRYSVSLGGIQMDSLDEDLLILDIGYTSPDASIVSNRVANADGYDFNASYFEKNSVTITFELHIYDTAKRNAACQAVNAWAMAGGTLAVNDRPDQVLLHTRCEKYASIESARNWTDPLTLVFSTTYVPYWVSEEARTLTLFGSQPSGTLNMDGNIGNALVSVDVTATDAFSSFQIKVGDSRLTMTGLSVPKNGKLVIDYIRDRYLRITANGSSALAKVNPSSSTDMLYAPCGSDSSVTIIANGKVTAAISARGLWL